MSVTQVLLSCNHIIMIATLLPTWRCDYKTFGLIFKSYPTANQCFVNESSSRNKVAVGELVSGITYSWYLFSDLVTSDPRNEFSTGIMITPLAMSYQFNVGLASLNHWLAHTWIGNSEASGDMDIMIPWTSRKIVMVLRPQDAGLAPQLLSWLPRFISNCSQDNTCNM